MFRLSLFVGVLEEEGGARGSAFGRVVTGRDRS